MKSILTVFIAAVALGSLATVGVTAGCASNGANATASNELAVQPVNEVCPIGGHDVVPSVGTVSYMGKEVGFCCEGCLDGWQAMTPAEKDAALAAAMPTE
ncbi:MAG: hypothetical protein CMJ31_07265 [Phycisphaerae bacterium]|nr:hypothetical protein [Phycisphaerae bacterium]|tara:strand:- start:270 stop:569 length:300 start_codon:yes stop_codon:yes gene_type:complete